MIKIFKEEETDIKTILSRTEGKADLKIEKAVSDIIFQVRTRGDAALIEYNRKFDRAQSDTLRLSEEEIKECLEKQDAYFLETLYMAKENITEFHSKQIKNNFVITKSDGTILGQKITPIDTVGLYVPGGTAAYPSTVLMNAIPAKLAGVKKIVMTTPPPSLGKDISPIIAAAAVAGVDEIYTLGGAQAIAALAYGTESVPKADKIVGPGNIYVATAKRMVFGQVGIDMIAGPSEILVIADDGANPAHVAADMLSQAEHDENASAVLIALSEDFGRRVSKEIYSQIEKLPRKKIALASIENNSKIIIADSIQRAVEISNLLAPEHLELAVENPFELLCKVTCAGSIFLGYNTCEAMGDYFAGPNHTLPTSSTARFSSPLSVDDFVKKSSFTYFTRSSLEAVSERVADFACREGLSAHARSLMIRFDKEDQIN